jgi:molybdopterin molybdotransferase
MISVTEATHIIESNLFKPKKEVVKLERATGRIVAESIFADRDFPPFNRATMDGIAIDANALFREDTNQGSSQDAKQGNRASFMIEGTQAAGQPASTLSNNQNCVEIMTGAMLPNGTNAVVRYEDVEIENGIASVKISTVNEGDNIHFKGMDARENSVLIKVGTKLSPAEIALLASVGKTSIAVFSYPTIAIISTGDELVSIGRKPLPHQIRTSNSHAIRSALIEMGCHSTLFHLTDNEEILKTELDKIASDFDVIILSGGVSKGKFDFVPAVLESLGIKKIFHQVSQKPGKPMWFGHSPLPRRESGGEADVFVFALPGNPVSTFMCFHRYVKPWLLKSCGVEATNQQAVLASDFLFKPALTYFLQANIKNEAGKLMAYPVAGGGSGDFVNLKEVNGFLELPAEKNEFKAGEVFLLIRFK